MCWEFTPPSADALIWAPPVFALSQAAATGRLRLDVSIDGLHNALRPGIRHDIHLVDVPTSRRNCRDLDHRRRESAADALR